MFDIPENQQVLATLGLIVVATAINLLMVWYRNMREYASVAVWALVAIYARHAGAMNDIAYLALGCATVVFINICIHGYQNRATNPMLKFKQWRASKV